MATENKYIDFDLNFIPNDTPPKVFVHEYDTGHLITFKPHFYYGDEAFILSELGSCVIYACYVRPDGTKQMYELSDIVVDSNTLAFPCDKYMAILAGDTIMSLGFYPTSGASILWTQNFILSIEKNPMSEGEAATTTDYEGMIAALRQQMQNYVDSAWQATPEGYQDAVAKVNAMNTKIETEVSDLQASIEQSNADMREYVNQLDITEKVIAACDTEGYIKDDELQDATSDINVWANSRVTASEAAVMAQVDSGYYAKEMYEDGTPIETVSDVANASVEIFSTEVITTLAKTCETITEDDDFTTAIEKYTNHQVSQGNDQVIDSISGTYVKNADVTYTDEDGKEHTGADAITTATNTLTRNLEGTQSEVDQYYSDMTNNYATKSLVEQTGTSLTTTVEAYTDAQVGSLSVNGRNLAQSSKDSTTYIEQTLTGGSNEKIMLDGSYYIDFSNSVFALQVGDKVRIGFWIQYDGITYDEDSYNVHLQGNRNNGGTWKSVKLTGGNLHDKLTNCMNSGKLTYLTTYFVIPDDFNDGTYNEHTVFSIRHDGVTGTVKMKAVKIEIGAVSTAWTPSMDNIYANIPEADTYSKITQTATDILAEVSTTYATGASVTALDTKIDTTANGIYAIMGSISGSNLLFDTNVSSLTKSLAPNNRYFSDSSNATLCTPEFQACTKSICGTDYMAVFPWTTAPTSSTARRLCWYSSGGIYVIPGNKYTFSAWFKTTNLDVHADFEYGYSSYTSDHVELDAVDTWQHLSWTVTMPEETDKRLYNDATDSYFTRIYIGSRCLANATGTLYVTGFKLESGEVATAWSDNTAAITQLKVTADGISSEVSKKVGSDEIISTINQSAESVTIDANKINLNGYLTVSSANSTYSTKADTYKSFTMHYLASASSSGVKTSTDGWTTSVQSVTASKKYLWTYQTLTYANGSTSDTTPVITGVYGDTGAKGDTGATGGTGATGTSVSQIIPLYYCSNSTTAPSAPTSAVSSTSTSTGAWRVVIPKWTSTYKYIYTCNQVKYSNNTYTWSTVTLDQTNSNMAAWCNSTDSTYIDGSKIYTGTVTADKLKLYGDMTVYQSSTGSSGGSFGYASGNDGQSTTNGMRLYRDSSHYLHISSSGAHLNGGTYLALTATSQIKMNGSINITGDIANNTTNMTLGAVGYMYLYSKEGIYSVNGYDSNGNAVLKGEDSSKKFWVGWSGSGVYLVYKQMGQDSDRALKQNIVYEVPDIIDQLKPCTFEYKDDPDKTRYGLIAQDVQEVNTNFVIQNEGTDTLMLNYVEFVPLLIDKCQKLQSKVDDLENRLAKLESLMNGDDLK